LIPPARALTCSADTAGGRARILLHVPAADQQQGQHARSTRIRRPKVACQNQSRVSCDAGTRETAGEMASCIVGLALLACTLNSAVDQITPSPRSMIGRVVCTPTYIIQVKPNWNFGRALERVQTGDLSVFVDIICVKLLPFTFEK
jgi:hypothetical protein